MTWSTRALTVLAALTLAAPAGAQDALAPPGPEPIPTAEPIPAPAPPPTAAELREQLDALEAQLRALEAREGAPPPAAPADAAGTAPVGTEGLVLELPMSIKLKIQGHLRLRGEWRSPRDYRIPGQFGRPAGENPDSREDFVLQRAWVGFDFQVRQNLRAYVSIMDVRTWGDQPVGNDAAETFLREGFVELQKLFEQPLSLKLGRTLVPALGDGRLFHSLDPWANMPRLWDAVQVTYEPKGWWLYGTASNLREAQVQTPRGDENDDFWLTGVYASNRMVKKHELDAYVFWRVLSDDVFRSEARGGNNFTARLGDRKDYTGGLRFKGEVLDGLLGYSAEGVYQWGDQAGDRVQAWAAAGKAWTVIKLGGPKVRVGAEYAYASGDQDPNDGVNETFDPIFPFGHFYHGHMDQVLWKNVHAVAGQLAVWPVEWLSLHSDGHVFWLDKRQDAWYGVTAGGPVRRDATGQAGSHLGVELDLYAQVKLWDNRLFLWAGYSHFWTGEYVRETGKSEDMDWAFCHLEFNF